MAARKNLSHSERVKETIKVTQLVRRLRDNAIAPKDKELMTPSQVNSAKYLIGLVIPQLKAVEVTGNLEVVVPKEIVFKVVKPKKDK